MQKLENLSVLILAYNRFEKFNRCIKRLNEQGIKKYIYQLMVQEIKMI